MRIKDGYVLRRVGEMGIVIPIYEKNRDQMVTLNHSAVALWNMLGQETNMSCLIEKMMEKYDVTEDVLKKDIEVFLCKIRKVGLLEE